MTYTSTSDWDTTYVRLTDTGTKLVGSFKRFLVGLGGVNEDERRILEDLNRTPHFPQSLSQLWKHSSILTTRSLFLKAVSRLKRKELIDSAN